MEPTAYAFSMQIDVYYQKQNLHNFCFCQMLQFLRKIKYKKNLR